jgi:hypothetical protein
MENEEREDAKARREASPAHLFPVSPRSSLGVLGVLAVHFLPAA